MPPGANFFPLVHGDIETSGITIVVERRHASHSSLPNWTWAKQFRRMYGKQFLNYYLPQSIWKCHFCWLSVSVCSKYFIDICRGWTAWRDTGKGPVKVRNACIKNSLVQTAELRRGTRKPFWLSRRTIPQGTGRRPGGICCMLATCSLQGS